MSEKLPVVLLAGIPRSSFEGLAPVLDRQKVSVVQVTSAEDSIKFAYSEPVELLILNSHPKTMSLEEVVRLIRAKSSASNSASILVLAEPGDADGARKLLGRGVNRVMLAVDPPELIAEQVAGLLEISARTKLRLSTRVSVEVADGWKKATGSVVNMSAAGLLLETDADIRPGQNVIISIVIDPRDSPVSGMAEVVRKADPNRDGVMGVGVRFLGFVGDGHERLQAILN